MGEDVQFKYQSSEQKIEEIEKLKEEALGNSLRESEHLNEENVTARNSVVPRAPTELTEKITTLEAELETYKQYLADWQVWAENKNSEYDQLLEAYNAYVEAYNAMSTDVAYQKNAETEGEGETKVEEA